jgi:hypothetical protein
LESPGKVPVEIIKIQIGSCLGGADIVRGDDVCERAPGQTT